MLLSTLFAGQPDIEISGITLDSRTVRPGYMFFCIEGTELDGHKFAGKAAEAGAAAIVCSKPVTKVSGVTCIQVCDTSVELNRVSDLFFDRPSRRMTVFGATGTNGKSTMTSIISDIYSAYKPCGYMGTIAIRYGGFSRVPNLTTPDPVETHANLKEMLDHGMQAVAMEVSSQGLDRGRVEVLGLNQGVSGRGDAFLLERVEEPADPLLGWEVVLAVHEDDVFVAQGKQVGGELFSRGVVVASDAGHLLPAVIETDARQGGIDDFFHLSGVEAA